jgi:hypothetical protein
MELKYLMVEDSNMKVNEKIKTIKVVSEKNDRQIKGRIK